MTSKNTHSAFTDLFEDLCTRVLCNVMSDFKVSESSGTLGMNDTFWDSLAIEVRNLIDEVDVLQQDWSVRSDSLGSGLDTNWSSTC